jgi:hypothetical protein
MDADFAKDVEAAIESHREPLEPPACGLILDSSVLIKAERRGQNARQVLASIARTRRKYRHRHLRGHADRTGNGAARADTAARKAKRQQFIQELLYSRHYPFIRSR